MITETFPVGQLQCNCSIIICPETKEAIVVDPGGEEQRILSALQRHNAVVKWILHTHAHLDHVAATVPIHAATHATIGFHRGDQWLVEHLSVQAMLLPLPYTPIDSVGHWIRDGERFTVGVSAGLECLHTPGHTPGSLSFRVFEGDQTRLILSGDTLFREGIGRSDLWGGDHEQLMESIQSKLFEWPDDVPVVPGHGPNTTLAFEKEHNPFLS